MRIIEKKQMIKNLIIIVKKKEIITIYITKETIKYIEVKQFYIIMKILKRKKNKKIQMKIIKKYIKREQMLEIII